MDVCNALYLAGHPPPVEDMLSKRWLEQLCCLFMRSGAK